MKNIEQNVWQRQMSWAHYVAQDYRLADSEFRLSGAEFLRIYLEPAKRNIEMLVSKLENSGYEFKYPKSVLKEPEKDVGDWMYSLEELGIFLPISLQAWLEVVGTVNLMGTHPDWDHSGYASNSSQGIWYTDPLVVDLDKDYILSEIEEWRLMVAEDGEEEHGPFRISFAPDDLHKANVSGGAPYELSASKPSFESLVYNGRHGHTFVAHIRNAFRWGGFPGFEVIDEYPLAFIRDLRKDLLEF